MFIYNVYITYGVLFWPSVTIWQSWFHCIIGNSCFLFVILSPTSSEKKYAVGACNVMIALSMCCMVHTVFALFVHMKCVCHCLSCLSNSNRRHFVLKWLLTLFIFYFNCCHIFSICHSHKWMSVLCACSQQRTSALQLWSVCSWGLYICLDQMAFCFNLIKKIYPHSYMIFIL